MTNFSTIVDEFAVIDAQIKELSKKRDAIKKDLLEVATYVVNAKGVEESIFVGEKVDIVVTKTYPTTFSKDLAQTLLSDEDFVRCHATAIKPTCTPRVVVKSPAFV